MSRIRVKDVLPALAALMIAGLASSVPAQETPAAGPVLGPAPGTAPPPARKPPTLQQIAQGLAAATNRSPEAYSEYLMTVLNPQGAQAHHEPPEPGVQDGLMSPLNYARHQANMDMGMVAHSPDYRYEKASARVEGNDMVILTYTEAMTLPNGQAVAWPMTNRFVIHNGWVDDVTVVLNEKALAEIAKMMAVVRPRAAAGPPRKE